VKLLHTSDWHVGKTLKGRSRLDEQREVLAQVVAVAREQQVDAVLIAGDLYDSSAPSAAAQQLVIRGLLALRDTGAEVIAIAGNHDHPATFDAYRPLMAAAGITLVGTARDAESGGVVNFTRALACDLARDGIRVNAIAPGFIDTRMALLPDGSGHEHETEWFKEVYLKHGRLPLGRAGLPADIAGPAFFLCSDDARYVTGQILLVDGGVSATF